MRRIRAKYDGRCRGCGDAVGAGDTILWSPEHGAAHLGCGNSVERGCDLALDNGERCPYGCKATPRLIDFEVDDATYDRWADSTDEAEYQAGITDGKMYSDDVKMVGRELAERFSMDRELAAYNRGDIG